MTSPPPSGANRSIPLRNRGRERIPIKSSRPVGFVGCNQLVEFADRGFLEHLAAPVSGCRQPQDDIGQRWQVRGLHRRVARLSGEGFSTRESGGDRGGEMPPDGAGAPRTKGGRGSPPWFVPSLRKPPPAPRESCRSHALHREIGDGSEFRVPTNSIRPCQEDVAIAVNSSARSESGTWNRPPGSGRRSPSSVTSSMGSSG